MPKIRDLESYFWGKTRFAEGGCIEWTGALSDGYGTIKYRYKTVRTHRLAWEIVNGSIPDDLHVLHSCDNRRCVSPQHLRLGTHDDNMRDKVERGRCYTGVQKKGEEAHRAKLTAEQVADIRQQYPARHMYDLADDYGVSVVTIWRIVHRVTWRDGV